MLVTEDKKAELSELYGNMESSEQHMQDGIKLFEIANTRQCTIKHKIKLNLQPVIFHAIYSLIILSVC
jgi:hypothetical protein